MTAVPIPDDQLAGMTAQIERLAINETMQKVVETVVTEIELALDSLTRDAAEEWLQDWVCNEAMDAAGKFVDLILAGSEPETRCILHLPHVEYPHLNERLRQHDLVHGSEYGSIAFRARLWKALRPRVRDEVIEDLHAEIKALRTECAELLVRIRELQEAQP